MGCEKFRYAFGTDEMLMNAEAGLYFEFDEENGIPKNCEGLENFNMDNWINDNGSKFISNPNSAGGSTHNFFLMAISP